MEWVGQVWPPQGDCIGGQPFYWNGGGIVYMAPFKWEGRKAVEGGSAVLGQGFSMVSIKLTDCLSHDFWEASSLESKSGEQ